ncbi:MAG: hypothetical protein KBT11_06780 [Treponema sp.]|nr:hypothetical protein [Candidatus Treponema equifaecale]
MKKAIRSRLVKGIALLSAVFALGFMGCADSGDDDNGGDSNPSKKDEGSKINLSETPTIFLAGDSTVKTYDEEQWIGGWGQYLSRFLDSSVVVKNCAQGGRSSRSFINEGRLYKFGNYTFSENEGIPIGEQIKEGDYLFVQFGHNDDDTKDYPTTLADRQVGLGKPDANGKYPVTPGVLVPTTYIPAGAQPKAGEIEKYGDKYYSYNNADGSLNGTYKWYLKQYIDFARSKKAVPVLVTPVCRVSFDSDGKIKGGPGLHGDNFAYVQAVRQLAEEENCLLIDLFAETVKMQETATPAYSDGLMAIVPNDLKGEWPAAYDAAYKNADLGYQKMEGTHYNKYGAFITCAKLVENIMAKKDETHKNGEKFSFVSKINKTPEVVVHPNIMSKATAAKIEALCTEITVSPASRDYPQASAVVTLIGAIGEVTQENYTAKKAECEAARKAYNGLNADDRSGVTNLSTLEAAEAKVAEFIEANRAKASKTVIFNFEKVEAKAYENAITVAATEGTETISVVGASGKAVTAMAKASTFKYAGVDYNLAQAMSMGGSAGFGANRYIEFTLDKAATVTVIAQSSSSTADRVVNMVKKGSTTPVIATFDAKGSLSVTSKEIAEAGTYQIGSAGSGMYIVQIIIEYFN